jgi:hypothetical protein
MNMKKLLRNFAFFSLFGFLPFIGQSQSLSDTFTLHVQTKFWKTGQATKGVNISVPNLPPFFSPGIVGVNTAADSSTFIVQYVPDILDDDFCISAFKDGDAANGLNIGDLLRISRHILGIEPLTGFAKLAADANRSSSITTFDIVELRKLILGIYQELPNSQAWYVLPEDFLTTFESCQKVPQMPLNPTDSIRFVSIKIGDVDGDANPAGLYQLPLNSALLLGVPNSTVQAGQTLWLPIATAQNVTLTGIQFGFKYDPNLMEIINVRSLAMQWSAGNFSVFQNAVTCIGFTPTLIPLNFPASSVLAEIQVKALQDFSVPQALSNTNEKMQGLWVDEHLTLHPIDTAFAALSAEVEPIAPGVEIGAPMPNPFSEKTFIPLALEKPDIVFLELNDVSGKRLLQQTFQLQAGQHNLEISGKDAPSNSLLIYRIWTENWSHAGKILRH